MDCDYCPDSAEELIALEDGVEVDGDKGCMPVVAVDDVGSETDEGEGREHSLREVRIALEICKEIIVGPASGEIFLVVDEVVCDAVEDECVYAYINAVVHLEIDDALHVLLIFLGNHLVLRDDDSHVILVFIECLRKTSDDICQSSGFNERHAFSCNE